MHGESAFRLVCSRLIDSVQRDRRRRRITSSVARNVCWQGNQRSLVGVSSNSPVGTASTRSTTSKWNRCRRGAGFEFVVRKVVGGAVLTVHPQAWRRCPGPRWKECGTGLSRLVDVRVTLHDGRRPASTPRIRLPDGRRTGSARKPPLTADVKLRTGGWSACSSPTTCRCGDERYGVPAWQSARHRQYRRRTRRSAQVPQVELQVLQSICARCPQGGDHRSFTTRPMPESRPPPHSSVIACSDSNRWLPARAPRTGRHVVVVMASAYPQSW